MPIDEVIQLKLKNQEDKFSLMFEQNEIQHTELKNSMELGFETLGKKIDDINDNKANKWVEKLIIAIGGTIGLGLLTWLGSLVYKATVYFE